MYSRYVMEVDLNAILREGAAQHQAGDLVAAAVLYARILAVAPGHADANHLMGLVHHQQGHNDRAVDMIRTAIACDGKVALYHANLGRILRAAGRDAEAVAAYRDALRLDSDNAVLHSDLAAALVATGDFDAARARGHLALELDPGSAEAHLNLGLAHQGLHGPDSAEAVACFRRALAINPRLAGAHLALGVALHESGDAEAARRSYGVAIALDPTLVEAHCNLGNLLRDAQAFEAAIGHYRQALAIRPEQAEVLGNLAVAQQETGDLAGALETYERALRLDPENAEIRRNRAMALLAVGDFAAGWPEYAWRWKTARFRPLLRDWKKPQWTGADPAGKRILVHAEQGYGDTIQFMRYLPLLAAKGAKVIFECPPLLADLARRLAGVADVVAPGRTPQHDLHVPLLDLPGLFGTTVENIPAQVPYIEVPAAARRRWADFAIQLPKGKRIGIAWRGNPEHPRDALRSPGLLPFVPLLVRPDCVFVSLQRDGGAADVAALPPGTRLNDPTDRLKDFADTAALMAELDLVISCDSAPAHLAGALGLPVILLLPHVAEWRWGREGDKTPWYPSMTLVRQPGFGDWAGAVKAILNTL